VDVPDIRAISVSDAALAKPIKGGVQIVVEAASPIQSAAPFESAPFSVHHRKAPSDEDD
jgi:hypothetical protein